MSKKKKPPRLTSRQTKFVKELAKGQTHKQAAINAGYAEKHADQAAHQALERIRAKMADVMDRHGLTDDVLVEKYLVPLLKANTTKFFAHEGTVKDSREVEDNDTRTRSLDMAFKLKGSYAPKTQEEAAVNQSFLGPTVIVLDLPRPKRPALDVPAE
jgi:phage terminase small subunit